MNSIPKVSVMIMAYNQAHLIRETLDSILAQDYDNLEVVVADDASTDGMQNILLEYAALYPEKMVVVLNPQNLGITGNANVSLGACTGELIALFSGDDVMLPGKIKAQVEVFMKNPEVVMCYHPVEIFNSDSGQTLYVTFTNPRENIATVADIILGAGFPASCGVMIRRSAIPLGQYDSRLPNISDVLFLMEVALEGKIAKVAGVYARYRKHVQGASYRQLEFLDESLYAFDLMAQKHPEHPELTELCRQGKARYLAGEAFRQMGKDTQLAYQLAQRTVALDSGNLKYQALLVLCRSPLAWLAGPMLNRAKYFIKRYL